MVSGFFRIIASSSIMDFRILNEVIIIIIYIEFRYLRITGKMKQENRRKQVEKLLSIYDKQGAVSETECRNTREYDNFKVLTLDRCRQAH